MKCIRLGEVITAAKPLRSSDSNLPVLSITKSDGIVLQSEKFKKRIASVDTDQYKIVKRGQLVQGIHIDEANFGIQTIVDAGIVSPAYKIWNVDEEKIIPKYLETVLRSPKSTRYYASKFNGSVKRRERLSDNDFLSMEIPFPNREEQKFIVDLLAQVQTILTMRRQELQMLDELIKARFVEMFGDIIINSQGWPTYKLDAIATSRLGKMLDAKKQTGRYTYPYLANTNVQWFKFDLSELRKMDFEPEDQEEFEIRDGDLMVCEGGEVGRCAVWHNEVSPCFFQKAIHRVRCDTSIILPEYLGYWFKWHSEFNAFEDVVGSVTTIAHLPGVKLKNLDVVVPPIQRQKAFVAYVAQCDKSKVVVRKALEEAQLLFDSLMQKYFG